MNPSDEFFCANCGEFLDGSSVKVKLLDGIGDGTKPGDVVNTCDWCARAVVEEVCAELA